MNRWFSGMDVRPRLLVGLGVWLLAGCSVLDAGIERPLDITAVSILATDAAYLKTVTQAATTPPPVVFTATPSPVPLTRRATPTLSNPKSILASASTPAGAVEPQIFSFTAAPTTTHTLNDKIALTWRAEGERAEICSLGALGPIQCQAAPLAGSLALAIGGNMRAVTALGLRVSSGSTFVWSTVGVSWCTGADAWFFDNPPTSCPVAAPVYSRAAAQYFEHGWLLWLEATDTFYAFYTEGRQTFERLSGPLDLKPGASADHRIDELPPAGYVEPVSGFGLIWREEVNGLADVRRRLGWAVAPEFGFDSAYQCAASAGPRAWDCYVRNPNGRVLHLHSDSTAQVVLLWEAR